MRKLIATTAAGLALATGAVAVAAFSPLGAAGAQTTTPTTQEAPADGAQAKVGHPRLRHAVRAAVKDAAEVIGIPAKDLATALRSGQSVAEVATAHGVDPQAVIAELVTDATARIDKAVADGKLDQARADKLKAGLTDRVTKLVNRHFDGSRLGQK